MVKSEVTQLTEQNRKFRMSVPDVVIARGNLATLDRRSRRLLMKAPTQVHLADLSMGAEEWCDAIWEGRVALCWSHHNDFADVMMRGQKGNPINVE